MTNNGHVVIGGGLRVNPSLASALHFHGVRVPGTDTSKGINESSKTNNNAAATPSPEMRKKTSIQALGRLFGRGDGVGIFSVVALLGEKEQGSIGDGGRCTPSA